MTSVNTTLAALLSRHSVRAGFEEREVSRSLLKVVLSCGEAAPSSKNAQPWRFHVVTDPLRIANLADAVQGAEGVDTYVPRDPLTGAPRPEYTSSVTASAELLRHAPVAIWVENLAPFSRGRRTLAAVSTEARAGSLVAHGFELIGIGAAIENMWIAANVSGLGASFMGDVVVAERAVQEDLGFSGDLVGVLVIGYSSAPRGPSRLSPPNPELSRTVWH